MPKDRKDKPTWKRNGRGEQDDYVAPGVRRKHYDIEDDDNREPDDDDGAPDLDALLRGDLDDEDRGHDDDDGGCDDDE